MYTVYNLHKRQLFINFMLFDFLKNIAFQDLRKQRLFIVANNE